MVKVAVIGVFVGRLVTLKVPNDEVRPFTFQLTVFVDALGRFAVYVMFPVHGSLTTISKSEYKEFPGKHPFESRPRSTKYA